MPKTFRPNLPSKTGGLAFVGEFPSADDEDNGEPFCSDSGDGRIFDGFLSRCKIVRDECLVTHVFHARPMSSNIDRFFIKKAAAKQRKLSSDLPTFGARGILDPALRPHIDRLKAELEQAQPKVIVAMGPTALWALTGQSSIAAYRGVVLPCTLYPRAKVIATFSPTVVRMDWAQRPVVMVDLLKAVDELPIQGIRRTSRSIWIMDKMEDLAVFENAHLKGAKHLSVDVETYPSAGQINCFALAPSPTRTFVIPIWNEDEGSFWTVEQETEIMFWLQRQLGRRDLTKVLHNCLYDLTYFEHHGIAVADPIEDTMLLHHALQPELRKSLGFLGSLYLNESAWKNMRVQSKADETKKDA